MEGDRVVGLVDFGDSCFNPTICELGVCLPYMMMGREDPLHIAADIVAGYHQASPLSRQERAVLLPLICGRLAVSVSVAADRRRIDPDHLNWFDGDAEAWSLLQYLFENEFEREKDLFQ